MCLLVVIKLTSERQIRPMIAVLRSMNQPAIKFNTRTRPGCRYSNAIWREHMLQMRPRGIARIESFEGTAISVQLIAKRTVVGIELPSLKVQGRLKFAFMKHVPAPALLPSFHRPHSVSNPATLPRASE